MAEYYEKEALIKHLQHRLYECAMNNSGEAAEVFADCARNRVHGWLVDAPVVDVRPVVRGKWIEDESGVVICSNCGEEHEWETYRANYCDTCGADMRKETDDDGE